MPVLKRLALTVLDLPVGELVPRLRSSCLHANFESRSRADPRKETVQDVALLAIAKDMRVDQQQLADREIEDLPQVADVPGILLDTRLEYEVVEFLEDIQPGRFRDRRCAEMLQGGRLPAQASPADTVDRWGERDGPVPAPDQFSSLDVPAPPIRMLPNSGRGSVHRLREIPSV